MSLSFQVFPNKDVTDEMLDAAATLFREHYGIWGKGTMLAGNPSYPTSFQDQLPNVYYREACKGQPKATARSVPT